MSQRTCPDYKKENLGSSTSSDDLISLKCIQQHIIFLLLPFYYFLIPLPIASPVVGTVAPHVLFCWSFEVCSTCCTVGTLNSAGMIIVHMYKQEL